MTTTTLNLPRWAAYLLTGVCAVVALGAACVQFDLFTLAIHLTETRPELQTTMACMTLLFVAGELLAVFIAGLMPEPGWRRRFRLLAAAAVALEVVMIFGAQVAMARSADSVADAQKGRIERLRKSIASQRMAIDTMNGNGKTQSESKNAYVRAQGANSLRSIAQMEGLEKADSKELADLEAAKVPTATEVFGERGMIATKVASAVLVSAFCLTFSGGAGALIASVQGQPRAASAETVTPVPTPASADLPPTAQRWAAAGVTLAAIPAAAFAAPTVTVEAAVTVPTGAAATVTIPTATEPTVTMPAAVTGGTVTIPTATHQDAVTEVPATAAPVTVPATATLWTVTEPAAAAKATGVKAAASAPTATTRVRYERIRAGIVAGTIRPSVRAVQAAEGGGTAEVRTCLQQLERDGTLVRVGQGWVLRCPPVDTRQMELIGGAA